MIEVTHIEHSVCDNIIDNHNLVRQFLFCWHIRRYWLLCCDTEYLLRSIQATIGQTIWIGQSCLYSLSKFKIVCRKIIHCWLNYEEILVSFQCVSYVRSAQSWQTSNLENIYGSIHNSFQKAFAISPSIKLISSLDFLLWYNRLNYVRCFW